MIRYAEDSHATGQYRDSRFDICPITSRVRGGPFEIAVAGEKTSGVILANQVRTIDLTARGAKICDRTDDFSLREVIRKLKLIVE